MYVSEIFNATGCPWTYLLNDELRNAVANLDLEICLGEVCEDDTDLAAVVCVDDTSHGVNAVFGGEAGARGNAAVCKLLVKTALRFSMANPSHITRDDGDLPETWNKNGNVQVPAGTAMLMSVSTLARPLAGITTSRALYRSWPAAKALPLVGARALSLRSWTWRACSADAAAATLGAMGAAGWRDMARGVGVKVPFWGSQQEYLAGSR